MMGSLGGVVSAVALLVYVVFLGWRAFRPALGFASWHMFARVEKCNFELRHEDGREFNPWDYLPHFYISMTPSVCGEFLAFLREVHGIEDLHGVIHTIRGDERGAIAVRGSHVVD